MRSWCMHSERSMDGGEKHMRVMQHRVGQHRPRAAGLRACGLRARTPVDRTAAREHHLGGHSGGRVGLEAERSSRHAVTN